MKTYSKLLLWVAVALNTVHVKGFILLHMQEPAFLEFGRLKVNSHFWRTVDCAWEEKISLSMPWRHTGGIEVPFHSLISLALDKDEWLVTYWIGGFVSPRAWTHTSSGEVSSKHSATIAGTNQSPCLFQIKAQ